MGASASIGCDRSGFLREFHSPHFPSNYSDAFLPSAACNRTKLCSVISPEIKLYQQCTIENTYVTIWNYKQEIKISKQVHQRRYLWNCSFYCLKDQGNTFYYLMLRSYIHLLLVFMVVWGVSLHKEIQCNQSQFASCWIGLCDNFVSWLFFNSLDQRRFKILMPIFPLLDRLISSGKCGLRLEISKISQEVL